MKTNIKDFLLGLLVGTIGTFIILAIIGTIAGY